AKVLAGGLPGGCLVGRADVLAHLEFRPGKPKMKHPGTFNANPLSAAAGTTTLRLVAGGEPCRRANDMARLLRRSLHQLFTQRGPYRSRHRPRGQGGRPGADAARARAPALVSIGHRAENLPSLGSIGTAFAAILHRCFLAIDLRGRDLTCSLASWFMTLHPAA